MHRSLRSTIAAAGALVLVGGLSILIALFGAGSGTGVSAQGQETPEGGISVTGEGRVNVSPDVARASIGVEETGDDLSEVLDNANQRMDAVIEALRDQGIPEEEIQTQAFSILVERDHEASGRPISGFTVVNRVQVEVTPTEDVAEVIEQAVDAGANQVGNIHFVVEDRDAAVEQAREQAVEDAREKAEHLAELGNVSLGPIVSISETAAGPPVPEAAADEAVGGAGAPPIEPGQQTVGVTIQVVYSIE